MGFPQTNPVSEVKVTVVLAKFAVPEALSQLPETRIGWVVDALKVPLLSKSDMVAVAAADVE